MSIYYVNDSTTSTASVTISGTADVDAGCMKISVDHRKGIHPKLYFKYIKKKFKVLEQRRLEKRLKQLEAAFDKAVKNGQSALGEKILMKVAKEARESAMYARGIKHFIEHEDIQRHKRRIRGGHISDTKLKDYTRLIPYRVMKRKDEVEDLFDGFVIYHYWNEDAEDEKEMSHEEKEKMKDPVLFGYVKETDRLYFVADWEDECCDLTFDELVDKLGMDDEDVTIPHKPKL